MDLLESRIYTFVDPTKRFAVHFFEGQQVLCELALIHPLPQGGFAYFRDVVLSFLPMITLLKHGEEFGFYLDGQEPYLRLKLEASSRGHVRCMLMPEDLQQFPDKVSGIVRLRKSFPHAKEPYHSIIEVQQLPLHEIVNQVLLRSYQFNSLSQVSQQSDQSYLILQLPGLPGDEERDYTPEALHAFHRRYEPILKDIMAHGLSQPEDLAIHFQQLQFLPMGARSVKYFCSCSQERMLANLQAMYIAEGEDLFPGGRDVLEVTCEYCKRRYEVTRAEIEAIKPVYN
jgi:molecular chaperone Hsp33